MRMSPIRLATRKPMPKYMTGSIMAGTSNRRAQLERMAGAIQTWPRRRLPILQRLRRIT